jgi:hypothetical protein
LQRRTGEVGVEPDGGEDLAREETRTVGELARAAAGGEVGVQDARPETGEARCSASEIVVAQERGLAARLASSRGTRQTRAPPRTSTRKS